MKREALRPKTPGWAEPPPALLPRMRPSRLRSLLRDASLQGSGTTTAYEYGSMSEGTTTSASATTWSSSWAEIQTLTHSMGVVFQGLLTAVGSSTRTYAESVAQAWYIPFAKERCYFNIPYTPDVMAEMQADYDRYPWETPERMLLIRVWNANRRFAAARERAEGLLCSCLTPKQVDTLFACDYFDVVSPGSSQYPLALPKGVYRIRRGQFRNVYRIDPKTEVILSTHCLHPDIPMPHEDAMLAQKLYLEARPDLFAAKANRWEGFMPSPGGVT